MEPELPHWRNCLSGVTLETFGMLKMDKITFGRTGPKAALYSKQLFAKIMGKQIS